MREAARTIGRMDLAALFRHDAVDVVDTCVCVCFVSTSVESTSVEQTDEGSRAGHRRRAGTHVCYPGATGQTQTAHVVIYS